MTSQPNQVRTFANELTMRDAGVARGSHPFDRLTHALNHISGLQGDNRDVSVEPSGNALLPATERNRPPRARKRPQAIGKLETPAASAIATASITADPVAATTERSRSARARKVSKAKRKEGSGASLTASAASITRGPEAVHSERNHSAGAPTAPGANITQEASGAPPTVSAASISPVAVAATTRRASGAVALVAAIALATVGAYFSVTGMAEIFPGAPVAVMVLAATMEAGKLVIAGWLAAHWRPAGWKMRSVLVALVAGLALINAAGVFGKLVEAHVGVAASARSSVAERIEALDARVTAQSATVADLDRRVAQIDNAVDESTRRGRANRAIAIAAQQRVTRDGLDIQRQAATATLVGLQAQRAALVGERVRVQASSGPIQYLAMVAGAEPEAAVRWLILLMVLCCDPAAIALTVAATVARR
jgi:hypothetical protein